VIKFSTLREFFKTIEDREKDFPVVQGELQFCSRGCYTSAASVKRTYRDAENLVNVAERKCCAAQILGKSVGLTDAFEQVWRDVLFNQFHDILPGSSIERVCSEALDHLGQARHSAKELANNGALAVTACILWMQAESPPLEGN
jgi:alpha-mannosidase